MGKVLNWLCVMLMWLSVTARCWAGLTEGLEAYDRGDYRVALREFGASAEKGNPIAQFHLGLMNYMGKGVPQDKGRAARWYESAAEQGHASAQFNLGVCYLKGEGVSADAEQAVSWFRKAAEQAHVASQYNLGAMYAGGYGGVVPKNDQQAIHWWKRAAENGYAEAQYSLGRRYFFGEGVPQDDERAFFWWQRSAEGSNSDAWVGLGALYSSGRGVPKDSRQAILWYRKAAEQGDAVAQFNLGVMYAEGEGIPRDNQQAYFWWLLSAAQGAENAANLRDQAERELTQQQRASAQAAAREWRPKAVAGRSDERRGSGGAPAKENAGVSDSSGSGFYVAQGRVITNNHVTEGCGRLRVDGSSEARLHSSDPRNDLALISVKSEPLAAATLRMGRVKVGESATVVGYPLSGLLSGFNVTTGNVSSLAGVGGDTRMLQITAPVQAGNSGGPLLDASGKVMGVVVSKLNALKVAQAVGDVPQNVNFAINANVLASFLDANGVDYKAAPTGPAIPTQEIARRAQAFTVLVECWK